MNILFFALIFSGALASSESETSDSSCNLTPALSLNDFEVSELNFHDFELSEFDFEQFLSDTPSALETYGFDQQFSYLVDTIEPIQTEAPIVQEYPDAVVVPSVLARPKKINTFIPENSIPSNRVEASCYNLPNCSEVAKTKNSEEISSLSSSSNCIPEAESLVERTNPRSKRAYSTTRNEDELSSNKMMRLDAESLDAATAKRTSFCHRSPFLYKTTCDCKKHHFGYISAAIKHAAQIHNCNYKDYNACISCVDDFSVIEHYPIQCNHCPFRSNLQVYLYHHLVNCHGRESKL